MELIDFVCVEAIRPELNAENKSDAIRQIITALSEANALGSADADELTNAVLEREELGTTGIGRGVAIPHARHAQLDKTVCTFAIIQDGIDFNSLDGEDVNVVALMLSPPDHPEQHLAVLQQISVLFQDELTLNFLRQATTPQAVVEVLEEVRQRQVAAC